MENGITLLKQEQNQLIAIMGLNRKGENIATLIQQEIAYLEAAGIAKPVIMQCKPLSVLLAVKSVLKQNLTLDPYAGLVYIKTRNVKVSVNPDVWETAMEIQPTCNGLISIARQCGRILDIKRPQITKNKEGQVNGVSVEILLPSTPEPRWEKFEFDEDDFYRWRRASNNESGRGKADVQSEEHKYANPNYKNFKGGIDPEFARAKAIRHSLKKLGVNQHEVKPGQMIIDMSKTPFINPVIANIEGQDNPTHITEDIKHEEVKSLPKTEDL